MKFKWMTIWTIKLRWVKLECLNSNSCSNGGNSSLPKFKFFFNELWWFWTNVNSMNRYRTIVTLIHLNYVCVCLMPVAPCLYSVRSGYIQQQIKITQNSLCNACAVCAQLIIKKHIFTYCTYVQRTLHSDTRTHRTLLLLWMLRLHMEIESTI